MKAVEKFFAWLDSPLSSRVWQSSWQGIVSPLGNTPNAGPSFAVVPPLPSPTTESPALGQTEINWFYLVGSSPFGPVSTAELKRALSAGELGPAVSVFRDGLQGWQRAKDCVELFPPQTSSSSENAELVQEPAQLIPEPSLRVLVKVGDEVRGPLTFDQLKSEVLSKRISLSDLGQEEGASGWVALTNMPEVLDQILPPLPDLTTTTNTPAIQTSPITDAPASSQTAGIAEGAGVSGIENASQPAPVNSELPATHRLAVETDTARPFEDNHLGTRSMDSAPSPTALPVRFFSSETAKLVTRRSRLFAQLSEFVIGFILVALFGGIAGLLGSGANGSIRGAGLAFALLWLVANSVLLAKRGQTVGKMLFGIKIVDFKTGHTGGARVVLLRYLLLCLLSWLQVDPILRTGKRRN